MAEREVNTRRRRTRPRRTITKEEDGENMREWMDGEDKQDDKIEETKKMLRVR